MAPIPTKCSVKHEHRRNPEDEDGEVQGVLDRPPGPDGGKAIDRRIRTDDQAHEDEHEDEEQGASNGGEPAPSIVLSHQRCASIGQNSYSVRLDRTV
jgi:hypothetical protein